MSEVILKRTYPVDIHEKRPSSPARSITMKNGKARQTFIAQIDFALRDRVPNEFVRVNPLGLQISYFRVDQAFEEGPPNGR